MTPIITPALVRRYLRATWWTVEQIGDHLAWTRPDTSSTWTGLGEAPFVLRSGTLKEYEEHGARLGMLAAAEMTHERATLAKCDDERAVYHEMDALERSLVSAAGVDPEAWEKARGA